MPQFRSRSLLFALAALAGVLVLPALCAAAPPPVPEVRPALPAVAHPELRASAAPAGTYLYLGACQGAELVGAHVEALPACERIEAARGFVVTLTEGAILRSLPSPSGEAIGLRKAGTVLHVERVVQTSAGEGPRYLWGRLASTHADCGGINAINTIIRNCCSNTCTSPGAPAAVPIAYSSNPCEVQPANRPEGGTGCSTAREVAPHLLCHLRGSRSSC